MKGTFRFPGWVAVMFVPLALESWGLDVCRQALADDPRADSPLESFMPKASLRTTSNEIINLHSLVGDKVAVYNLMYTLCDGEFCAKGMPNLIEVQNELARDGRLGKKVVMISITLQPEHDTPDVLKAYADGWDVKPGWFFLTGDAEDIQKLRLQLETPPLNLSKKESEASGTRGHTGMLQIINGATGKRTSISITSKPERILDLIGRVESPEP